MIAQLRAEGGEIFALTSEPQTLAANAQEDWATGMAHVGDPHQEILATCRARGWLTLFTAGWGNEIVGTGDHWMAHPKGYFQPGVLALTRKGRVLYRWRCTPNRQNIGGAIARPTPEHVWAQVAAALEQAADAPDAPYDEDPELDARPAPWPLFVSVLMANGWFLRPVAFDQRPGEDTVRARQRRALRRLPLFPLFWLAVFALLPWWAGTLLFSAWAAKAIPGIITVHRRFQNVQPDEEPA